MNKVLVMVIAYLFSLTQSSCRSKEVVTSIVTDSIVFNDSITSSRLIVIDDGDKYFEKIQPIDVAIQLKNNSILTNPNYKNVYKDHLKTQVSDMSKEDKILMQKVVDKAMGYIHNINPNFDLTFSISKIKTVHYGKDVFYTRGNVIYFPENVFQEKNVEKLTSIMLHEIWHILSEQNPELKEKLYKLIGFEKHNNQLSIPPQFKSFLLTNPDGGDWSYAMKTKSDKWLIPLIKSNQKEYSPSKQVFYDYLQFDLYYLNKDGVIEMQKDNSSNVSLPDNELFFKNIKENTQYIIHPDEIIADNFMLAVLAENKNDYKNFSSEGQELLKQVLSEIKGL